MVGVAQMGRRRDDRVDRDVVIALCLRAAAADIKAASANASLADLQIDAQEIHVCFAAPVQVLIKTHLAFDSLRF